MENMKHFALILGFLLLFQAILSISARDQPQRVLPRLNPITVDHGFEKMSYITSTGDPLLGGSCLINSYSGEECFFTYDKKVVCGGRCTSLILY